MISHAKYREGHINEAFVGYAFLSELGYEVAQSNAAFLLDRSKFVCFLKRTVLY